MERALRAMVEKHRLQRDDLDVPKQSKREYLKEFGDLLLHHQEKDLGQYNFDTFDNVEMCEYVTYLSVFFLLHVAKLLMSCPVLEAEKQFIEAAKMNDVETMRMVGRGLNFNAKNVVCFSHQQAREIYAIL